MANDLEIHFTFDLEALAAQAVEKVAAAVSPRALSNIERNLIEAVFWARASSAGEWVDIELREGGASLCLERGFERGFIAQAARMLKVRRLELVT